MANADRIIELLHAAKARAPGVERERFLAEACRDDAALEEQIVSLLEAEAADSGSFLQRTLFVPPPAPVTEKPGDRIGRYKLLEQIGEGGCGVVYMAEQEEPVRRRVALKVIKLGMDTKQVIARFEAERQALAMMDHPNIAKVLDGGATDTGRPFFVMELVRGIKITEYCDQNNLSTNERLELFIQVCQAIQHAHQKGIIHRDIKPSNILVTHHDDVAVPKVIDFGIAKATVGQLTDKTVFTAFAQFVGTPAYMSPEQAQMSGLDIDTRADIYSLGVLLYELLTGNTPFDAKELLAAGMDEMRRKIREDEPAKPSTCLSTMQAMDLTTVARRRHVEPPRLIHLIRGDLDWLVMKCLEKDRTRRYATANALAMDLQRHLNDEPVVACPPSRSYRFQKLVRRNQLAFAAGTAVALALVFGVVASTWQAVRATQAEHEQSRLRQEAEEARGKEATLRQQAEAREKLVKVQVLCDQLKFDEAEKLMSRIPDSVLHTARRDAGIVFKALTDFHARRGRWKEALPSATKAVECEPTDFMNYISLLALLAADGDLEKYRLYCRELLDRFSQPEDTLHGEIIAKACLMLPSSGVDLAIMDKLVEGALTEVRDPRWISYRQFAKGLAEYRQGRFGSVSNWMRKSIDDPFYGAGQMRYVQSYMVLAMAQQQLKQPEEARKAFAKGLEIEEAKLPKLDSGDLGQGWYWRDWIIAHALMNEAKALIDGQPAGSTKLKPDASMER